MQVMDVAPHTADGRAEARRRQIILATIGLLAAEGSRGVTFARIREAAGLSSTRLISYHFESKFALLDSVVVAAVAEAASIMRPAVDAATTVPDKIEAYIRSNLEFLGSRPNYAKALIEALRAGRAPDADQAAQPDDAVSLLSRLFELGIESGQLRRFDAMVMARTLRAAIDAVAILFASEGALDLDHYSDELVTTFRAATRKEPKP